MGSALLFYFAAVHGLEVLGVDDPAEVPGRVAGLAGALVELAGVMADLWEEQSAKLGRTVCRSKSPGAYAPARLYLVVLHSQAPDCRGRSVPPSYF